MEAGKAVHIVDDDEALRRATARAVASAGYAPLLYASGDEFLAKLDGAEPGCVVLDLRMPGSDGPSVQQALRDRRIDWPVLILTGFGDVDCAVRSLKSGAVDFLQKPYRKDRLIEAVAAAQRRLAEQAAENGRQAEARERISRLSPREREVLAELKKGVPHKVAAFNLGISVRTVEVHRAQALRKLEVRSLAEALQILFDAG